MPVRKIRRSSLLSIAWSMAVSVVSVITSVTLAGIAMHRCINHWELVLVAFWKLTLSLTINCVGMCATVIRNPL